MELVIQGAVIHSSAHQREGSSVNQWKKKVEVLVAQSCLTLSQPHDCSLPGSSVHGILQARILVWVAISFSRGSSQLSDRTQVSCIAGGFFTICATREAQADWIAKHTACVQEPKLWS